MMKIVFLDRDGVINEYPGDTKYVTSWSKFYFISGSIQAIRLLKEKGFKVFVVSNQAGVGKGIYSQDELNSLTHKMIDYLRKEGAELDGVYYCIHREEDNCNCRKPKTGLLEEAVSSLREKPEVCFFIGDSFRDMKAARAFGCMAVLVLSGKEKIGAKDSWEFEPDYVFSNLLEAVRYICSSYE